MTHNDLKHLVQRQFGQNPEGYVQSITHAKGKDLPRMVELIQPQPDWIMLDIATGGGHTARTFAPDVARVVVTDLTADMLQAARGHIREHGGENAVYGQVDAENLSFGNNAFDLVTCRVAPHHFPDVGRFVREAARVVRPGGIVAVVDQITPDNRKAARYVNAFERLRDPSHAWAYSLRRWQGFFEDAGLVVWHTEPFEKRLELTDWAVRMGCAPEVITRLRAMLTQAPEEPAAWFGAEYPPGGDPTFAIHQAIMLGRKES